MADLPYDRRRQGGPGRSPSSAAKRKTPTVTEGPGRKPTRVGQNTLSYTKTTTDGYKPGPRASSSSGGTMAALKDAGRKFIAGEVSGAKNVGAAIKKGYDTVASKFKGGGDTASAASSDKSGSERKIFSRTGANAGSKASGGITPPSLKPTTTAKPNTTVPPNKSTSGAGITLAGQGSRVEPKPSTEAPKKNIFSRTGANSGAGAPKTQPANSGGSAQSSPNRKVTTNRGGGDSAAAATPSPSTRAGAQSQGHGAPPAVNKGNGSAAAKGGKPAAKPVAKSTAGKPVEMSWADLTRTGRGNSSTPGVSAADKMAASNALTGGSGRGKMDTGPKPNTSGAGMGAVLSGATPDPGPKKPFFGDNTNKSTYDPGLGRSLTAQQLRDFKGSGR